MIIYFSKFFQLMKQEGHSYQIYKKTILNPSNLFCAGLQIGMNTSLLCIITRNQTPLIGQDAHQFIKWLMTNFQK